MNVVLDTNIVVSALISLFGAPARIVELVLAGEIHPAFDDRVMAEYREVLSRARFGFDSAAIAWPAKPSQEDSDAVALPGDGSLPRASRPVGRFP